MEDLREAGASLEVANTGENSMTVDLTEALCREWGKIGVGG